MKLGVLIAVLSLATLPTLPQETLADYDTSQRVSFTGTVDAVIMPPGELPVCFLMTVQNSGRSEQWMLAGDAFRILRKAGWRLGPAGQVKPGTSATVSVFLPKPGSTAAQSAQGIEVKLADGQMLPFGPPK